MIVTSGLGIGETLNMGMPESTNEMVMSGGTIALFGAIAFLGMRMTFGAFDKPESK